jgi:hypothetical protein
MDRRCRCDRVSVRVDILGGDMCSGQFALTVTPKVSVWVICLQGPEVIMYLLNTRYAKTEAFKCQFCRAQQVESHSIVI